MLNDTDAGLLAFFVLIGFIALSWFILRPIDKDGGWHYAPSLPWRAEKMRRWRAGRWEYRDPTDAELAEEDRNRTW